MGFMDGNELDYAYVRRKYAHIKILIDRDSRDLIILLITDVHSIKMCRA